MTTIEKTYRQNCYRCRCALSSCYCNRVRPFDSNPVFSILIHPKEIRKTIATGLMAHRCLSNSYFFEGRDFTQHSHVNQLIEDGRYEPLLLYPSPQAVPLDLFLSTKRTKIPLFFVLDGTWKGAQSMFRASKNLQNLPRVTITPRNLSQFIVRKQPRTECLSTIEAIHHVLDLGQSNIHDRTHDHLLEMLRVMVTRQLKYTSEKVASHV